MRVYLTGADGMFGTALTEALAPTGWELRGVTVRDFDIADGAAVDASVGEFAPDIIVHTAAHAIVDDCEADPKLALRVNVDGVRAVAAAARKYGSKLVYLSSDYVFDGRDVPEGGYREDDIPNPLSVYGLTKLAGERITATVADHLIIRTSWLFGSSNERTDNVLATVRGAVRGQRASLIDDQFSCPTYTVDLADAIRYLLTECPTVTGTVHIANGGTASWHDVGRLSLRAYDPALVISMAPTPTSIDDCGFLGGRPHDSTLNTNRLAGLGYRMPAWSDAVIRFCARLAETAAAAG